NQTGREVQEHERKHYRHEQHHLGLARVPHHRRHLLLDEHRRAHQHGKDIGRVMGGEIADPDIDAEDAAEADERLALQFYGYRERHIQCIEDRNLYDHRQATTQRVDLVGAIQRHGLLLEPLWVVFVFRSDRVYLGLQRLHGLHRGHALDRQGKEQNLGDHGQEDDRDPVITEVRVEEVHDRQDRNGQPLHRKAAVRLRYREPTEIYGFIEVRA